MRIYLDHAATTPLLPEAREAMEPWLGHTGNPSSLHQEGRKAKAAIDEAREAFADAFGCLFAEVLFCSSGTEAANLAIMGTALAHDPSDRRRILLGATEHHCVLHQAKTLAKLGYQVDLLPVDREGLILPESLSDAIDENVLLVSVMSANNELGTIQPSQEIGRIAKEFGTLYHVDAVQTFPSSARVDDWQADFVSVSAHKFHGPVAIGALYHRAGTTLHPLAVGGSQERELRAGTENVAGIVGAGVACRWVASHRDELEKTIKLSRDTFAQELESATFSVTLAATLPGHCHIRYPGLDAETLLIRLDREGIAASSGAACSSGSLEPSHVLIACGYSEGEAKEGLRFTFGKDVSVSMAREAARIVKQSADEIRASRQA